MAVKMVHIVLIGSWMLRSPEVHEERPVGDVTCLWSVLQISFKVQHCWLGDWKGVQPTKKPALNALFWNEWRRKLRSKLAAPGSTGKWLSN